MDTPVETEHDRLARLEEEIANFRALMAHVHAVPGELSLKNIDIHGATFALDGQLGVDHIIFVDFARRYDLDHLIDEAERAGDRERVARLREGRRRIGVLLADASGHSTTHAVLTAMLHQAFLTGVLYELEMNGHVTAKLFEILNTRFHQSSSVTKFLTMVYGEISEKGIFRFISAGHPPPMVFSAEFDCFVRFDPAGMVGLAGMDKAYMVKTMQEFKTGKRPATVMHQLAKGYSDDQIVLIANYYSKQK